MGVPKHQQVRDELFRMITGMPADERLPEERGLAERFAVSRATIRQALRSLSDEGKIYSVRGRGTFVAPQRVARTVRLASFSEDMRRRGLTPGARVIRAVEVKGDAAATEALELAPRSSVYVLTRLRLADGFPMCVETIWLPPLRFPSIIKEDLTYSLYEVMDRRYAVQIERADERIGAAIADPEIARLLDVPDPSPVLEVTRRGFDNYGRVAEFGKSTYRADRYEIDMTIDRRM